MLYKSVVSRIQINQKEIQHCMLTVFSRFKKIHHPPPPPPLPNKLFGIRICMNLMGGPGRVEGPVATPLHISSLSLSNIDTIYHHHYYRTGVFRTNSNRQRLGNGPCITGRVGRVRFCRPQYPPPKTQNLLRFRGSSAGMAGVVRSWSISIRPYWQPPIRVACHQHRSTAGIRPRTIVICTFHSGCSTNRWRSWCRGPTIR